MRGDRPAMEPREFLRLVAIVLAILIAGAYNPARSTTSVTSAGGRPPVKKSKRPVFHLYRYQILPLDAVQDSLFDRPVPLEELIERKNEIFADALRNIREWQYHNGEIIYRFEGEDRGVFALRMGILRPVTLHTKEFEYDEKEVEDWPKILILIDNEPDAQKAGIQLDYRVFQQTATVARILESNLNRVLRRDRLSVFFEPLFERGDFWRTVQSYPNQITRASFELISPNMSNISRILKVELGDLHRATNTQKTKLELNSEEGSALRLTPDDPTISSIVDYASEGGGKISLKIRGLEGTITTSESIKEITISELEITGDNVKQVASLARSILE